LIPVILITPEVTAPDGWPELAAAGPPGRRTARGVAVSAPAGRSVRPSPGPGLHRDLRRPNVTLALPWEEYRAATIDGFGYSGSAICIAIGRLFRSDGGFSSKTCVKTDLDGRPIAFHLTAERIDRTR
jgi:hypothetical protein